MKFFQNRNVRFSLAFLVVIVLTITITVVISTISELDPNFVFNVSFFLVILVFSFLNRLKAFFENVFKWFNAFLRVYSKLVFSISLFFFIEFLIVWMSYLIYTNNSESFALSDEITKKDFEMQMRESERKIQSINDTKLQLGTELTLLKLINEDLTKGLAENPKVFHGILNNENLLIVKDSLIVVFNNIQSPPDNQRFILRTYDIKGKGISTIYLWGDDRKESVESRIARIKHLLSKTDFELNEIRAELNGAQKWSALSFISYYYNGQLQPITAGAKVLDLLQKVIVWILLAIIAGIILPPLLVALRK